MDTIQVIKKYQLTQKQAYIIVFSILVVWIVSAYAVMHMRIKEEATCAKLINISGQQRMLSQQIGLHSQLYYMHRNPEEKIKTQELVRTMLENHAFLLNNLVSEELKRFYSLNQADIDSRTSYCRDAVKIFFENTNEQNLKKITDCSQQILPIINQSVTLFQKESERKSKNLQKTELFILIGTLLTLLLEALFIIRPVLKRYVEGKTALDCTNKEKELQQQLLDQELKIVNMSTIIDPYVISSITDLNEIIIDVSEAFCTVSGYSKEELIGQSHNLIRHPDMSAEVYTKLCETIVTNQSWNGEFKNKAKDGTTYWIHAHISPLYDKHHQKIGYTEIGEDITSHREVLQEKEKFKSLSLRMDLALEAADIGIWEWHYATNSYIWDERMCELYGNPSLDEHHTFTVWSNMVDPEYIPIVEKNLYDAVKTNGIFNAMFWVTLPSGERRYIRAIGKGEKDTFGILTRMVGINVDITNFKINEDVLNNRVQEETLKRIEQEKILVQQSKLAAMGEMMANLAHQWKQPLMMVSMGALALQKKYNKGELDQEYMQNYGTKTNEIISRMSQTIVDFSEYFSPNKAASNFSLFECVQKNVAFLDPLIKRHNIVLHLNISVKANVTSFENELSQVLLNLLKNSIDAIAEKNIEYRIIEISIIELPQEWIIRVLDNGGGILEDILHRIFEPYFTTKFKSNGIGIGLYMSKMITEQSLHGSLEVINTDLGAEFSIKLPKGVF